MSEDEKKVFKNEFAEVTIHEDGSATADHKAVKIEMSEDGHPRLTLKKFVKLTLDNILDVQSHTIKRDSTATSHHIVMNDGGEARFSYRADGKLLEFTASKLSIHITPEGIVTLGVAQEEN